MGATFSGFKSVLRRCWHLEHAPECSAVRLLQEMHFFAFFRDREVVGAGARCEAGWLDVCVSVGVHLSEYVRMRM